MIIDMQRFCVILLALWSLSSRVRGQDDYYYDTTAAEATTAEEQGSITSGGTTETVFSTTTPRRDLIDLRASVSPDLSKTP